MTIRHSNGATKDNGAEVTIQARLSSLVEDQVARETIHVGLDIQILTVGAVIVRLSNQAVSKISLEGNHEDVSARLIQVGH